MKDYKAFEQQSGTCYIPEAEDVEYTYSDLLDMCHNNSALASNMFDLLEWQHPETLFDEWVREGEIDENGNFLNQIQ